MAGVDVYYIGDTSQPVTGDIALGFLKEIFTEQSRFPALKNAFWAIIVLSVLLLIVATIIAIIRQEYMPDSESSKDKPSNNKAVIFNRSVRSLFLFLIVPFATIFGLMISNILLGALDTVTTNTASSGMLLSNSQITSKLYASELPNGKSTYIYFDIFGGALPTTTTTFSGMMFKTAAYASNRVRINKTYGSKTYHQHMVDGTLSNFGIFNISSNQEEMAELIDEAFANNVHLNINQVQNTIILGDMEDVAGVGIMSLSENAKVTSFSKFRVQLVWYYYDLWKFNFIIGFVFLVVCAKMFINIIVGLMKRIIEIVALFLISPPLVALMPLDEGKAFNKWRETFISKALAAYGAIIGMNLIFIVLPYLYQIKFFTGFLGVNLINLLVSSLFIIVGLVTVDGFIALTSKMIGADDALKSGGELVAKTGETVKRAGMYAGGAAGAALKAASLGIPTLGKALLKTQAGQRLTNRVKDAALGAKSGLAGLTMSPEKKREISQKAQDDWERTEAKRQFDEKMQSDHQYQTDIDNAYDAYVNAGGDLSKEKWLEDDRVSAAEKAAARAGFESRFGKTFDQFKYDRNRDSERSKFIREQIAQNRISANTSRKQKILGAAYNNLGLRPLNTAFELFSDEIKDSFVRGGSKGGFKAMTSLFKGEHASVSELAGLEKKLAKEEKMRTKVQMKVNKELDEE